MTRERIKGIEVTEENFDSEDMRALAHTAALNTWFKWYNLLKEEPTNKFAAQEMARWNKLITKIDTFVF